MKSKISVALKNKYKNLGFGEKAFEGVADYLSTSITEESQIETAIAGVEGLLKAFQADTDRLRTDKSNAEKRAAELEAQAKSNGGAPDPKAEPKSDDTPTWVKDLVESNKALAQRIASMEGDKVATGRKQQLSKIIEALPENLRKPYSRIDVQSMNEDDFTAHLAEVEAEVKGLNADLSAKGGVFSPPLGGGSAPKAAPSKAEIDAVASALPL